jgi:hypothetical protein
MVFAVLSVERIETQLDLVPISGVKRLACSQVPIVGSRKEFLRTTGRRRIAAFARRRPHPSATRCKKPTSGEDAADRISGSS